MTQVATLQQKGPPSRDLLSLSGRVRLILGSLNISSYVNAGGEAFDIVATYSSLAKTLVFVEFQSTSGRQFYYDPATKKVSAFTAAGVEVANATNIGAVPFLAWVT